MTNVELIKMLQQYPSGTRVIMDIRDSANVEYQIGLKEVGLDCSSPTCNFIELRGVLLGQVDCEPLRGQRR